MPKGTPKWIEDRIPVNCNKYTQGIVRKHLWKEYNQLKKEGKLDDKS